MTPPDRLVQAAAEQIHRRMPAGDWPCSQCDHMARTALAAAFAALPDCEEAQRVVRGAVYDGRVTLNVLARAFGEPTP